MNNTAKNTLYTYSDYKDFPENQRAEIIAGQIYAMAPAPSRIHEKIIVELSTILNNHIKAHNGECEVYVAPFDVMLVNEDEELTSSKNIIQPDVYILQ